MFPRRLHNSTSLLKTVQLGDLQQCVAALVIMIHSYDLDLDNFSRGRLRNQSETSSIDCSTIPVILPRKLFIIFGCLTI